MDFHQCSLVTRHKLLQMSTGSRGRQPSTGSRQVPSVEDDTVEVADSIAYDTVEVAHSIAYDTVNDTGQTLWSHLRPLRSVRCVRPCCCRFANPDHPRIEPTLLHICRVFRK